MPFILGIDTGGTYTDSVLVDIASRRVLRKAKSFTTHQNLLVGILDSLEQLHADHPDEIAMVCLSTTLATNAVVENRGGRVGALLLGRKPERDLPAVLVRQLHGTLNIKGRVLEDIEPEEVEQTAKSWAGQVDAVAISGFSSVRNPVHELRIRQLVQKVLPVPIVCAHELSGQLGFQERTVTAVLNAALIPNIRELIDAAEHALAQRGIHAPILIVKGDGSLMHANLARSRPIETVLSGPAASIVGGLYLSGAADAMLLDMGGTTTDLARVQNGRISICENGASIGGWHTQLRAAEISTFGIGGDSRLQVSSDGTILVGPQRVLPLCVAGMRNPKLTEELSSLPDASAADCFAFVRPPRYRSPSTSESELFSLLQDGPHSAAYLSAHMPLPDLDCLVQDGSLLRCGLTPTDLLHIRGILTQWNTETARAGALHIAQARQLPLDTLIDRAFAAVEHQLCCCCRDAGFTPEYPIVALGAPVAAWLPGVCQKLKAELLIPEHAEVANAVGAAVGQIIVTVEALIRPDQHHTGYLVHTMQENRWFEFLPDAQHWALQISQEMACAKASASGSTN
ncbi:MAG: hydantoinase/oxoprolinase N-terminal domain-containing protein, partial [Butyricicoccus sp.]